MVLTVFQSGQNIGTSQINNTTIITVRGIPARMKSRKRYLPGPYTSSEAGSNGVMKESEADRVTRTASERGSTPNNSAAATAIGNTTKDEADRRENDNYNDHQKETDKELKQSAIAAVNEVSQYGAWVLLHGYAPNHFTGYINRQNTPRYPDIESTASALAEKGLPMKAAIEGSRDSGLRQTATVAVTEMVSVRDDTSGKLIQIPWTYAYYEIAERNLVEIVPGKTELFEGFLSSQARNLFEMTRR